MTVNFQIDQIENEGKLPNIIKLSIQKTLESIEHWKQSGGSKLNMFIKEKTQTPQTDVVKNLQCGNISCIKTIPSFFQTVQLEPTYYILF